MSDIERISIYTVNIDLQDPFTTAASVSYTRTLSIVAIEANGITGWGECSADGTDYMLGESAETARAWLIDHSANLLRTSIAKPTRDTASDDTQPMARAALDCALWDLYAKSQGQPLADVLGGESQPVTSRAVIGRSSTMLERAAHAADDGYTAIKLKFAPGDNLADLRAIQTQLPDVACSIDLNMSATPESKPFLAEVDALGLEYIEQPFDPAVTAAHSALAADLGTPVCLDESIRSGEQAADATRSGLLANLKLAKFGGITNALAVASSLPHGSYLWGGMLETNIGRAHALAVASVAGTTTSDLAGSGRYYQSDPAEPFVLEDGKLRPRSEPGIGVRVDEAWFAHHCTRPTAKIS